MPGWSSSNVWNSRWPRTNSVAGVVAVAVAVRGTSARIAKLAEMVARTKVPDVFAVLRYLDRPVDDHEEFLPGTAFLGEDLAFLDADLLRSLPISTSSADRHPANIGTFESISSF